MFGRSCLEIARRVVFIVFGAALVGVALEIFLIPNSIIDGGITGLSIMGAYLTGLPLGLFLVLLHLPFLLMGYRSIGKTFALSTLLGIIVLSVTATLLHPVQEFTRDTLLASVFGGILLGVGVGIVIRFGGSLDGTEMIAVMLNRKSPFSVGRLLCF